MQAHTTNLTGGLLCSYCRLFQIVKEVLDEKRRSLDKATSAVRSLEGVLADKDATIAEKDAIIAETGGLLTEMERRSVVVEKEVVTGAGNDATVRQLGRRWNQPGCTWWLFDLLHGRKRGGVIGECVVVRLSRCLRSRPRSMSYGTTATRPVSRSTHPLSLQHFQ